MTDLVVHPGEIADCAHQVGTLTTQSSGLNNTATGASVPEISWGVLGHLMGLYSQYDTLLGELHTHYTTMSTGFDKISAALADTARSYHDNERTAAEAFNQILANRLDHATGPSAVMTAAASAPSNLDGLGANYGRQWAIDSGKGNLVSQTAKAVPLVNGSYLIVKDSLQLGQDAKAGDAEAIGKDVVAVLADMNTYIQDGITLAGAIADPLNFLISKGLGWLLNVVAPLKQAVDLVTGDPDATSKAATTFNDIAKQTEQLARTYDDHLRTGLRSWNGRAADAAAVKLAHFHDGIAGTASTAGHVAALLQGSSLLMKAAEDIIKGILSDLIEWLVVTWVAAQLAAPVTAGGSEAVAAGASAAEAAAATTKATAEVNKVRQLLSRIMEVLQKVRAVLKNSKIGETFTNKVAEDQKLGKVAKTLSDAVAKSVDKRIGEAFPTPGKDPDGDVTKTVDSYAKAVNTYARYADGGYKMVSDRLHGNLQDDDTIDRELDI
ncbi:hypothetical protein [Gandjariella thermophila]|uniref:hypothetical protein n=1 Tax=Gandjariella thermophila TaxID=1931992 RepID=UPI0010F6C4ED|nr:hypothetical protein [Gandjariella thermophila]